MFLLTLRTKIVLSLRSSLTGGVVLPAANSSKKS